MSKQPTEGEEQEAFFSYLKSIYPALKACTFHATNEGKVHVNYRQKQLRRGLLPGVWDIFCMKPSRGYHGLWIEMKRGSNKLRYSQEKFLRQIQINNYAYAVCYSCNEALGRLFQYLGKEGHGINWSISKKGFSNLDEEGNEHG